MTDLAAAVAEHAGLFNQSVRSGDFTAFLDTFAPTAVMRFVGLPAGPYVGRDAIAEAYARQPPDDTMSVVGVHEAGPDTAQVEFAWSRGGTGSMTVSWHNGRVIDLTIALNPVPD
jgi:steroid delta-isomerase